MRAALLLTVMLAGCTTTAAPRPANLASYRCDRVPMFKVSFEADHAMLDTGSGTPIRLEQQPAASGFHYASPTHSIRGKDEQLLYTVGRMSPITCVPFRARR